MVRDRPEAFLRGRRRRRVALERDHRDDRGGDPSRLRRKVRFCGTFKGVLQRIGWMQTQKLAGFFRWTEGLDGGGWSGDSDGGGGGSGEDYKRRLSQPLWGKRVRRSSKFPTAFEMITRPFRIRPRLVAGICGGKIKIIPCSLHAQCRNNSLTSLPYWATFCFARISGSGGTARRTVHPPFCHRLWPSPSRAQLEWTRRPFLIVAGTDSRFGDEDHQLIWSWGHPLAAFSTSRHHKAPQKNSKPLRKVITASRDWTPG